MKHHKIKKILIISTFPPKHCGIATYAQEQFLHLKKQGHVVYSQAVTGGCLANYTFDIKSINGVFKAIILGVFSCFDEVYMHFTDGLIWPRPDLPRRKRYVVVFLQHLWVFLLGLRYGKRFIFVGHEILTKDLKKKKKWLSCFAFMSLRNIWVHTERDWKNLLDTFYPFITRRSLHIVNHKQFLSPKFKGDKHAARYYLNLPVDKRIILCIGFIQPHKGFDEVVEAMQEVVDETIQLYIVGSVREPDPGFLRYRDDLKKLVHKTQRCFLKEFFLSDHDFDAWIVASDAVVLPYREIWSSGVGARAELLKTPLIVKKTPGLTEQFQQSKLKYFYTEKLELVNLINHTGIKKPEFVGQYIPADYAPHTMVFEKFIRNKKILIVIPVFGDSVKGGAEKFCYELVRELARRGANIEVWTTDSDSVVGRNHRLASDAQDQQGCFVVKRFPVNVYSERLFNWAHYYINQPGRGGMFCRWLWRLTNIHGIGMERELIRRKDEFDVIHLFHYLVGSSHRLVGIAPHKTILHPFIHDEAPLRNPVMRRLFAQVRGVTCNTPEAIAVAQMGQTGLVPPLYQAIGNGVEPSGVAGLDRDEVIDQLAEQGYLLFMGRLIPEKNIPLLVQWFEAFCNKNPESTLQLVFIGEGPLAKSPSIVSNPRIHVLGWVDHERKEYALRHALALVNLSRLESFSLVLMEAWLQRTLVIVHKKCSATNYHIEASHQAGFSVDSEREFISVVSELLQMDHATYQNLAVKGFRYVLNNYSWDRVCQNYAAAVTRIFQWEETRIPLKKLGQIRLLEFDFSQWKATAVLNQDFYAQFEENARDGEHIKESWQYYYDKYISRYHQDAHIVDLGAGRGKFLSYLKERRPKNFYYGVDPDLYSIACLSHEGLMGIQMTGTQFCQWAEPFSVDVMILMHVIEHIAWPEWPLLLACLKAVIKPGGFLILELPNAWSLATNGVFFWRDPTHIRPINPEALTSTLQSLGYSLVDVKEFAPHLNPDQEQQLINTIKDQDLVKLLYGRQDCAVVAQRTFI